MCNMYRFKSFCICTEYHPVVQSVVSLTSSLRVISLTVLADSIHNILIFFAERMWVAFAPKSYSHFISKKIQHICIWPDVNFSESLTNDIVSFEQLGPGLCSPFIHSIVSNDSVSGQWRPWSDCADEQADLGFHCPHIPKDTFSRGVAQLCTKFRQKIWNKVLEILGHSSYCFS